MNTPMSKRTDLHETNIEVQNVKSATNKLIKSGNSANTCELLTIVIPTYNRPKYLRRALHYWGKTDFRAIVADGSVKPYDGKVPHKVNYIYNNSLSTLQRWCMALQQVDTPYVVLCADDDFLSVNGITACVEFLNNHSDYASAQGHAIEFTVYNEQNISIGMFNNKSIGHHICDNTAAERLNQLFDEYVFQIYSVFRTPLLRLAFEACASQKNPTYLELGAAIIPSIFGKHTVLPTFYSAKENIPNSARDTFEVPRFDVQNQEGLRDYEKWRDIIAHIYAEAESVPLNVAMAIVENTFTKYKAWDLRSYPNRRPLLGRSKLLHGLSVAKSNLKKIIPASLLVTKRRIYEWVRNKNYKNAAVDHTLGYPWSDPDAAKEWQTMVAVIKSHK